MGTNRASSSAVHSNSPKLGNCNSSKNDAKFLSGNLQSQNVATRSASVPSGTSGFKLQQRSLPAPPGETKPVNDSIGRPTSSTTVEESSPRETNRLPPSFYQNRGDYPNQIDIFCSFMVFLIYREGSF